MIRKDSYSVHVFDSSCWCWQYEIYTKSIRAKSSSRCKIQHMYVNLWLCTSIAHIDNIHHLFSTKNTLMIRTSWVLHLLQWIFLDSEWDCIHWLLLWREKRSPGKGPDLAKYPSSFLLSTMYLENICPSPLHLLGLAMNHHHVNSLPVEKKESTSAHSKYCVRPQRRNSLMLLRTTGR